MTHSVSHTVSCSWRYSWWAICVEGSICLNNMRKLCAVHIVYQRKYQFMFGFHGNISLSFNLQWHFIDVFLVVIVIAVFVFPPLYDVKTLLTCSFMLLIMSYIDRLSIYFVLSVSACVYVCVFASNVCIKCRPLYVNKKNYGISEGKIRYEVYGNSIMYDIKILFRISFPFLLLFFHRLLNNNDTFLPSDRKYTNIKVEFCWYIKAYIHIYDSGC